LLARRSPPDANFLGPLRSLRRLHFYSSLRTPPDPQPGIGSALGPALYSPKRLVWAITYDTNTVVCAPPAASPLASPCWPQPGRLMIILDYHTGVFIFSDI
jgi:hypothetical protein